MRKNDKELRNIGFQVTLGIFRAIGYICLLILLTNCALNYFNIGTDDSDTDGFNRSGLRIHKDAKTGKEYISTPSGALLPR
mgnify:CR=1 FL=1